MAGQVRRGTLEKVPEERRLLYETYFEIMRLKITRKAAFLVSGHDGHRHGGSGATQKAVEDVVNEGWIKVLLDPKDCPTPLLFAFAMFRRMEDHLKQARRLLEAAKGGHEAYDDASPLDIARLPKPGLEEEVEQRDALDRAREAVARHKPGWLELFDLLKANLGAAEITAITGRSREQIYSDRHRLHAFLTLHFKSGDR